MDRADKREMAMIIAQSVLENIEFCHVYEDEELQDASEEDLKEIHTIILKDLAVVRK